MKSLILGLLAALVLVACAGNPNVRPTLEEQRPELYRGGPD